LKVSGELAVSRAAPLGDCRPFRRLGSLFPLLRLWPVSFGSPLFAVVIAGFGLGLSYGWVGVDRFLLRLCVFACVVDGLGGCWQRRRIKLASDGGSRISWWLDVADYRLLFWLLSYSPCTAFDCWFLSSDLLRSADSLVGVSRPLRWCSW
jgi:hypothetical protein